MTTETVTIELQKEDAIVLDSVLSRFFGEGDLHDWADFSVKLERESEQ